LELPVCESLKDSEGDVVESCAAIATDADDAVKPIHDRMPVILQPKDYWAWLYPEVQDGTALKYTCMLIVMTV